MSTHHLVCFRSKCSHLSYGQKESWIMHVVVFIRLACACEEDYTKKERFGTCSLSASRDSIPFSGKRHLCRANSSGTTMMARKWCNYTSLDCCRTKENFVRARKLQSRKSHSPSVHVSHKSLDNSWANEVLLSYDSVINQKSAGGSECDQPEVSLGLLRIPVKMMRMIMMMSSRDASIGPSTVCLTNTWQMVDH